jgi:ATPase subunit of ABC transporter with duplicated ATPase domains
VAELEEVTEQRDKLVTTYEELRKKRLDEFMGGFTTIRLKLKEIYRTVTLEGDAELELVDSLDPFTEGIVLSVRPPKKSWKNVSNLSGGEKTLSSLSLVFALHEFRATPIYVMDEIDAALDFKNVSIIAHYIKERTRNAQFIIISLRNNMFELCDRLFGIYKVRNCTSAAYIAPDLVEFDEKKKLVRKPVTASSQVPAITAAANAANSDSTASNTAPLVESTTRHLNRLDTSEARDEPVDENDENVLPRDKVINDTFDEDTIVNKSITAGVADGLVNGSSAMES